MKKDKNLYEELGEERKLLQEQGLVPDWCTTLAWQMFKDKFITDNTPDMLSLYKRIAKRAATYTDNPTEWEIKFFDLFWKGWLAASTPILDNMGKGVGCPVSCFEAGTLVNTQTGLSPIETLSIGDMVLTHTGQYRVITNIMNSVSSDLYELMIKNETFFVTGNHLILTQEDGWVRMDELDPNFHNIVQIEDVQML